MKNHEWKLPARHLSGEISKEDLMAFNQIIENDKEYSHAVKLITALWNKRKQENLVEVNKAYKKLLKARSGVV